MQSINYSNGPLQAFRQKARAVVIDSSQYLTLYTQYKDKIIPNPRDFRCGAPVFQETIIQVPEESSFISFNEIKEKNISIAVTHAPYEKHFGIFWKTVAHMAAQKNSQELAIVMICAKSEKWDPYWPTSTESTLTLSDVSVKLESSQESMKNVTEQAFTLQWHSQTVSIKHYHVHTWKDGDHASLSLDEYAVIFKRLVESNIPIVVHCRAGIFRSGIVSVVLMTLKRLQQEQAPINEEVVDQHVWQSLDILRSPETGRSYLMASYKGDLLAARKLIYHTWNFMKSPSSTENSPLSQQKEAPPKRSSFMVVALVVVAVAIAFLIGMKRFSINPAK